MSRSDRTQQPVRAVIYARLSQDRSGKAEGVERQIETATDRAEREGWTLVREPLRDDGISAWRSGAVRPAYAELLRMVRAREVDVVLVWHMSRLWRGRVERATGIDAFHAAQVRLCVVQGQDLDFSTGMGRGMAAMLGELDTMESDVKSERIREAKAERQRAGKFLGGPRLFGFEKDGVRHRRREAEAIATATREVLAGRSLWGIAKEWNDAKMPTATGIRWTQSKVKQVLLRPRNAGLVATGYATAYNVEVIKDDQGVPVKAPWKPMVTPEEWDSLYRMLTDASHRRTAGHAATKWIGSGIYVCGRCGGPMRSASYKDRAAYRCAEHSHLAILANPTDDHVRGVLVQVVRDPRVARVLARGEAGGDNTADRERARVLRARLAQAESDFVDDLIAVRVYRRKTEKITAELAEVNARLDQSVADAAVLPIFGAHDPGQAFLDAPLDVQREVLRAVVTVTVLPNQVRGGAWTSDRLRVTGGAEVEAISA